MDGGNTALFGQNRILYNGPGTAAAVRDASTGQAAGYYVGEYGPHTLTYTLYDLSGAPLHDCGRAVPDAMLGAWVQLRRNVIPESGTEADSEFYNLDTGESRFPGYLGPLKLAEGVYSLTRPGRTVSSVLVDGELQLLQDLTPWYVTDSEELPMGYVDVQADVPGEGPKRGVLRIATGEILENFEGVCGPGLACFKAGESYRVLELASGRQLAQSSERILWLSPGAEIRRTGPETCEARFGDAFYLCRWASQLDGLFLLELEDGSELVLDQSGRELASTPALGAQSFSLLPGGRFCANYSDHTDTALYGPDGTELVGRGRYQSIYPLWGTPQSEAAKEILQAYTKKGDHFLYDLLRADGTPLLTGLNKIYAADAHGAAVRIGFTRGVMDYQGSWVWRESIFNTFEDEEEDAW